MGIWDKIKGEFVDIIEFTDSTNDTIMYRFDRYNNEIKYGAKLIVRESQIAVFVNEGKFADVYQPGTYTLETQNMPLMTTLKAWQYGFNSPFKAEVYFINTKNFLDQKWGTKNPITMRDNELGIVRLRAFGSYAFKVVDPIAFIKEVAGTDDNFNTEEVTEHLRNLLISRFTNLIAASKVPTLDLAANLDEFSKILTPRLKEEYQPLGLDITKFLIENISLPPEVEAMIDKRSSMGVIGNLNTFTQFQVANSVDEMASNGGGIGNTAAQWAMGNNVANQMNTMMNTPGTPPPITQNTFHVAINGQQQGPFDSNTLQGMLKNGSFTKDTLVWKQGMTNWTAASQMPELASIFTSIPPPLPPPII